MTLSVVIADDERLIRAGFRMILSGTPDIDVVAEAGDGTEAVDAVRRHRPDVVLMDVRMPRLDGIAATRAITRLAPQTAVLVVTTFDLDEYAFEALRAGAAGFLLKDAPETQLLAALRTCRDGVALLAPSVTRRLVERYVPRRPDPATHPRLACLTVRETAVLVEVARGRSNAEIAAGLHIGETTVKTHVSRLLTKLDLTSRSQAVVVAYETGLVTPSGP